MGLPSLLRKVFLVDLLQGLKVTFRYQELSDRGVPRFPSFVRVPSDAYLVRK